jgi:redox-sensitive bicupin YhaK (pirin superfamily)
MILAPRIVKLTTRTGIDIQRTLPHRYIRTIGAWCFVDHFGPTLQENAMSVAAHPHVGLQTVSWLFKGEVEHCDSLGTIQVINPGELNLMTAGNGVAHSELSLPSASEMHGVQLWIVLPNSIRGCAPLFDHYPDLPTFSDGKVSGKVMVGEFMGRRSPARIFSGLVGVELDIAPGSLVDLPLQIDFEYGALLVRGDIAVNQEELPLGHLSYLSAGPSKVQLSSTNGAKIVLLGGAPFQEEIVMWWNFIGRSHEEIVKMRSDWNSYDGRFPNFESRVTGRIPAPELPNLRLQPRGNAHQTIN